MSRAPLRFLAVAGVAALTFAAPATAFAAGHSHSTKTTHSSNKHHGKPASTRFTAAGTVTAVDASAGTVTLADKGGSKDLHGQSVTVVVDDSTKVTRDDASATLADVQVGDHVAANGHRSSDALTAAHLNASSQADDTDTTDTDSTDTTA